MGCCSSTSSNSIIYSIDKKKINNDDFELLKFIGKGSFGKVFLVRKKDNGKIYAMKVLRKSVVVNRNQVVHTKTERDVLSKVHHPFIVELKYAFQTEDKLYMVMEYINGGELYFHLNNDNHFSENRVRLYAAEIILALNYLHGLGVIYRDLKLENILLDSKGHICLTDFGLSKVIRSGPNSEAKTLCGTPEYLAPEILLTQTQTSAVDYWSLGTILFEMLHGMPPFYSENVSEIYDKILNQKLLVANALSPEAQSLLKSFIKRNPKKRLGSGPNGFEDIKAHPFFKGLDWEKVYRKEYVPEFIPQVKQIDDVSQIDPLFTKQLPIDSPVEEKLSKPHLFKSFTYIADDILILKQTLDNKDGFQEIRIKKQSGMETDNETSENSMK
ncbi:non-specific serine/threonine protein kinase [Anaeramoeba ignava]|uniref:non-specific serine/threonine protein kinase n=1 Tax=Anaeramoeba ignava TaxID=1746090 RepID=A0A9Q0RET9_ANAIG|nr:non-specific serine/threonine protein kinase [Anaeramoeba ignava]